MPDRTHVAAASEREISVQATGRIDPGLLVSGSYDIDDLADALLAARTGGAGKLMLMHPDRLG